MKTLASLSSHLEAKLPSGRRVVVARELTKIYEEVVSGTPAELINYFEKNKEKNPRRICSNCSSKVEFLVYSAAKIFTKIIEKHLICGE